jgi:hypothetical protein
MCFGHEPERTYSRDTLDYFIGEYLQIAYSFDVNNVFLSESNVDFGKLNQLEKVISSMTPISSHQKDLFDEFRRMKRIIDHMILPKQKKNTHLKSSKVSAFTEKLYCIKKDQNKKKYRSVLIITRSDTTGIEIHRTPL